LFKKVRKWR